MQVALPDQAASKPTSSAPGRLRIKLNICVFPRVVDILQNTVKICMCIGARSISDICRIREMALTEEQKHEKFRELAESRTNKALVAIGRIGNLSNRSLYKWEEEEVRKVLKALRDAAADVEARFKSPKGKAGNQFTL
jgi:hypothetical protein